MECFIGEGFDGGACKICLRVERKCCGGFMWSFYEEAASFLNCFIYFSQSFFGVLYFSLLAFDIDQSADLGLL